MIEVSLASEKDFSTLAHIAAVAMSVDLVHRIIYEGNDPFDTSRQEQSVMAELDRAASNPQAYICKATLGSSEKIVGYAMLRFEDIPEKATEPVVPRFAPGINGTFLRSIMSRVRTAHAKYMAGKRHVWWNHLMVVPAFQRMGVGSTLLQHGLELLGANKVPIWLVTQMRGRAIYLKFGFEDVEVIDFDLSDFAGPYQGFGIHRNICMVRQPGGVAGSDPRSEITR
ncbi:MAG: hypothetical protein Q9195_008654 [Heterodermia aff. obscurata]